MTTQPPTDGSSPSRLGERYELGALIGRGGMADVRAGRSGPVPRHLRDSHYCGATTLGHGERYQYPHEDPRGVVEQQYLPDGMAPTDYYHPSRHGREAGMAERLPRLRRIVRPLGSSTPENMAERRIEGAQ